MFVILPMGSGKSLCYCILPATHDFLRGVHGQPIVVVVSPLTLMKDQVQAMKERDIQAVFIGDCCEEGVVDVCNGKFQLVYMSPEALLTSERW